METYGKSPPRITGLTLASVTRTMTIARLAATHGEIRKDMETYRKFSPERILNMKEF